MTRKELIELGLETSIVNAILDIHKTDCELNKENLKSLKLDHQTATAELTEKLKVANEAIKDATKIDVDSLNKKILTYESKIKELEESKSLELAKLEEENKTKLTEFETKINDLNTQLTEKDKLHNETTATLKYESVLKDKMHSLNFSSKFAKNEFERQAKEKGLKLDDKNELIGFDEFVKEVTELDSNNFVSETKNETTNNNYRADLGVQRQGTNENDRGVRLASAFKTVLMGGK